MKQETAYGLKYGAFSYGIIIGFLTAIGTYGTRTGFRVAMLREGQFWFGVTIYCFVMSLVGYELARQRFRKVANHPGSEPPFHS